MELKICGLNNRDNIMDVAGLQPGYLGFIFYRGSKRWAGDTLTPEIMAAIPPGTKKVGVFVDEDIESVIKRSSYMQLDCVQLHGSESVEYCKRLNGSGIPIIKAFGVGREIDFGEVDQYSRVSSYFLFDNGGQAKGGTGRKFDWSLLKNYPLAKPYFLSGGIGPGDVGLIKSIKLNNVHAIDINSRFEERPGIKDVASLKTFSERLKSV